MCLCLCRFAIQESLIVLLLCLLICFFYVSDFCFLSKRSKSNCLKYKTLHCRSSCVCAQQATTRKEGSEQVQLPSEDGIGQLCSNYQLFMVQISLECKVSDEVHGIWALMLLLLHLNG